MLYTTLNKIRSCRPCADGWAKLLAYLGKTSADDEPLPFHVILTSNGLSDALWCCRSTPEYNKEWRLLAVNYARNVQHLMADPRSINAINVAEKFANGLATEIELAAAQSAAWSAPCAAAWSAPWAAEAAAAASAAAASAAQEAACAAADKTREQQAAEFLETVGTECAPTS